MKRILIKSGWFGRNTLDWYNGPDDIGAHAFQLVQRLKELGYDVQFSGDRNVNGHYDLELHLERQVSFSRNRKKVLVLCEPNFVQPQNLFYRNNKYDMELDWRTDYCYGAKRVLYNYPRDLDQNKIKLSPGYIDRKTLVNCIASNKNTLFPSKYSLYGVRQRYIEAFSRELDRDFLLFGGGWQLKNHPVGFIAKLVFRNRKLQGLLTRSPQLSSYRGKCDSKEAVMRDSKFTLCIENCSAPGAITEKIIDCFQHGSIPLYLGPTDINELIPSGLFVNLRDFSSTRELIDFMKNFSERDYQKWRELLLEHAPKISEDRGIKQYVDKIVNAISESLREIK